MVEHAHRGDHNLLGGEARDQRNAHLPVEAQRTEHRRHELAETPDVGVLDLARRTVELQLRHPLRLDTLVQRTVGLHLLDLRSVGVDGRTVLREVLQRPDNHSGHENHRAHLLQILHALVPHVDHRIAESRNPVGRQFHHKRGILASDNPLAQNSCHHY